jgi:hypothetical protein
MAVLNSFIAWGMIAGIAGTTFLLSVLGIKQLAMDCTVLVGFAFSNPYSVLEGLSASDAAAKTAAECRGTAEEPNIYSFFSGNFLWSGGRNNSDAVDFNFP